MSHRVVGCNTGPHFPVLTIFYSVKATQVFVYRASYHHGWRLYPLFGGEVCKPVLKYSGTVQQFCIRIHYPVITIHIIEIRKCGPYFRKRYVQLFYLRIKPVHHEIIPVKYMYELPSRPVDTGFKIADATHILFLAMINNPPFPFGRYYCSNIRICTAIVNYLYLHFVRPRILRQHTSDRMRKVFMAIVYRDHN